MLRFLSKVKLEYNALDARAAACKEFLAQCISKDSNSPCQLQLKYRTDDHPPQINVTFINGVEEVFDASTTSAQTIRSLILRKGQYLETEQMFRDAGEVWPVVIPDEELQLPAPGIQPRKAEGKKQWLPLPQTWLKQESRGQETRCMLSSSCIYGDAT